MSFRCEVCNRVGTPGESPVPFVVEKRNKTYAGKVDRDGEVIANAGSGWEAVKIKQVCKGCASILTTKIVQDNKTSF